MDITNQLIESFGKFDSTLNALDQRLISLGESVDKFNESTNKAADDEVKKQKKLTDYEKKRLQFEKKYDKEIRGIQKRFSTAISIATKTQTKLNQLNQRYNKQLQTSIKNSLMQNKVTGSLIKGVSMFKDAVGVAASKLKEMSLVGGAGRAVGGIAGKLRGVLPMAAILSVPGLIVRQLLKVSTTMAELARSTGLVGSNLKMVTNNVEQATAGLYAFGMNMEDVGRQAGALVDALGNASYVTEQLITNVSLIAKATGMSADEAANLTSTLIKGFDKTTPQVKEFADSMMSFASTSGVNARKVMRDIANDSNLTSIYLGRGEDYLMKSAVLAAKMGKSLAEQNQTLDAFSTIESSVENVAEINRLTGANLDAQKMFMMFQTQDTLGVMRELQGAFSNPRAIAMLDKYPGAFKQVAGSLNLSVKDLRQMDRVMADFEKSTMGASKSQQKIEDHIKAGMDLLEQMKGIFFSAILPAFNNIGKMLMENIKPTLNDATDIASKLGKEISKAMDAEDTLGGKIVALLTTLLVKLEPAFKTLGGILGAGIYDGLLGALKNSFLGKLIINTGIGAGVGAAGGAAFAGVGAVPGAIAGALVGAGGTVLDATMNAKGNVYSRPTLGIIGEENRAEVVIPTERIRKGLPVNASVAAELSSIGVPGFFAGGRGGGRVSSTAINTAANTFTARQQQRAVLASQGDPEAVRRIEAKIEKQAAEIRKEQRALVNDIMSETLAMERQRYRDEGMGSGGRGGGGRGFGFRQFEKGLHNVLTGLNNFMQVTGTGFKDIIPGLKNQLENNDSFFRKLPTSLQVGLETGVQAAYDKFLETGKLTEAVRAGAAAGVRAGTAEVGGMTGVAGDIVSNMIEGQGFRSALSSTLQKQEADKDSYLNQTLDKLGTQMEAADKAMELGIADALAGEKSAMSAVKAVGGAAKQAGMMGGLQGGIAAFKAGEGVQGVAKSAISGFAGAAAGKAMTGGLMSIGVPAPIAGMLGNIGGDLVGAGVGKALGFFGLGGKRVKPAGARTKITDAISGAMMGVTRPGMQLSRLFEKGSPKHKILQANIGIAAAKSPEKLYNKVGDIMYDSSGIRFSTDRVAQFTQALYQGNASVIDAYESEMEGGVSRAGASGAIVSRPTVALIGEAGPEALMPLENAPGSRPLNGVGGDGGEMLQEIKRMNQMLAQMANRPITLDGQRVNAVLNAVNSDDIRAGIYTVNSR